MRINFSAVKFQGSLLGHRAGVSHLCQMEECLKFDYHLSDFIEEEYGVEKNDPWESEGRKNIEKEDGWP